MSADHKTYVGDLVMPESGRFKTYATQYCQLSSAILKQAN
jgi:hypothetical protein